MVATALQRVPSGGVTPHSGPIWAQAYDRLRERVATLDLVPGQALSEKELAAGLNISRTPVREALIRLSEDGLIDIYPQFGTFVAPIRTAAVLSAQFIRRSLECALAEAAARRNDGAAIARMMALIGEQRRALRARDDAAFFSLDERMHEAMAAAAGHPLAWGTIQQSKIHLDRVRRLLLPGDLKTRRLVEEHERILAAVHAGDPGRAGEAMRVHLDGLLGDLDDLARRHPELFAEAGGQRPARRRAGLIKEET